MFNCDLALTSSELMRDRSILRSLVECGCVEPEMEFKAICLNPDPHISLQLELLIRWQIDQVVVLMFIILGRVYLMRALDSDNTSSECFPFGSTRILMRLLEVSEMHFKFLRSLRERPHTYTLKEHS